MKYKLKYLIDREKYVFFSEFDYSNEIYNINNFEIDNNSEFEIDIKCNSYYTGINKYYITVIIKNKVYYGLSEYDLKLMYHKCGKDNYYISNIILSLKDMIIKGIIE